MYLPSCAKEVRLCKEECNGFVQKGKLAAWRRLSADWESARLFPMGSIFPVTSDGLPKIWELG